MQIIVALLKCQLNYVVKARRKLPKVRHRDGISPFFFFKDPTQQPCLSSQSGHHFLRRLQQKPISASQAQPQVKQWNNGQNEQ